MGYTPSGNHLVASLLAKHTLNLLAKHHEYHKVYDHPAVAFTWQLIIMTMFTLKKPNNHLGRVTKIRGHDWPECG